MKNETTTLAENGYRNYGSSTNELIENDDFHCHSETVESQIADRRAVKILWTSVILCLIFMICEIIGGYLARSLAIVADAAHLLTDFASMLVSLFALYISGSPASQRMSFGWHRAEVLGAFISVFMIWIITGVLVYLAILRIRSHVYGIDAPIMAITASLGIVVNFVMAALLYFGGHTHSHHGSHRHKKVAADRTPDHQTLEGNMGVAADHRSDHRTSEANINVRAAMIHVIGDMFQSVGVLIAAILILYDRSWSIADPICTLFFSIIVLFSTIYIVRDAVVILLEGRPSSINFRSVFDSLETINGVKKVHNLRIWSLTVDKIAVSVHLEIQPDVSAQKILKWTTAMLRDKYGIREITVQIEGYDPNMQNCNQCIPPG